MSLFGPYSTSYSKALCLGVLAVNQEQTSILWKGYTYRAALTQIESSSGQGPAFWFGFVQHQAHWGAAQWLGLLDAPVTPLTTTKPMQEWLLENAVCLMASDQKGCLVHTAHYIVMAGVCLDAEHTCSWIASTGLLMH